MSERLRHLARSRLLRRTTAVLLAVEAVGFAVLAWGAYLLPPGNAPWYALIIGNKSPGSVFEGLLLLGPYVVSAPVYALALAILLRDSAVEGFPARISLVSVSCLNLGAIAYWIEDMLSYERAFGLTAWAIAGYAFDFLSFGLIAVVTANMALNSRRKDGPSQRPA